MSQQTTTSATCSCAGGHQIRAKSPADYNDPPDALITGVAAQFCNPDAAMPARKETPDTWQRRSKANLNTRHLPSTPPQPRSVPTLRNKR
jgi:hypothetical protein